MPSLRPAWPDLLDPTFREIFTDTERQLPTVGERLFNINNSTKNLEKDSSASGLTRLVDMSENQPITYDDEVQGYDVTYTHVKKGLGTSVSEELWEDDQFNVIKRKPANLATAKIRTIEQWRADILNGGFTSGGAGTAKFTAGDAVALFSASHPRADGGANQSNTSTIDLSEAGIETATLAMRATLDDRGQGMVVQPKQLWIPPALEKEALILLNSVLRPGTSNNDTNAFQGKLEIVVWDYLGAAFGGSDTAYFLVDPSLKRLEYFNRSDKGITGPDYDFETGTARWKTTLRASLGWSDWRGLWGSTGTGV